MIPWPIALLALFYGALATVSAATVWKIAAGAVDRPLIWALVWLAVSGGAMFGLSLLKPWGRTLAIVGAVLLALLALAYAALLIAAGKPLLALSATVLAGVQMVVVRYLRRPAIRDYFIQHNVPGTF